jgi:uncharacterized membrane protein YbhN (UPF0104 family)
MEAPSRDKCYRRLVWRLLGLLAVLALVAFLAHRNHIQLATIFSQPPRLLPAISALALALFAYLLAALRWRLLLLAQNIQIPFQQILSWTGLGHLCSYVSAGLAGGDVAKAICIARVERPRRVVAIAAIFVDRLIGLCAFGLLAAICVPHLLKNPVVFSAFVVIAVGAIGGVSFLAVLLSPRISQLRLVAGMIELGRKQNWLRQLIDSIPIYQSRSGLIWLTVAISMLIHTSNVLVFSTCAYALHVGESSPPVPDQMLLVPAATFSAVLVPAPGGVGVLEATVQYAYQIGNEMSAGGVNAKDSAAAGIAAAIGYRVCMLLVGAALALCQRRATRTQEAPATLGLNPSGEPLRESDESQRTAA